MYREILEQLKEDGYVILRGVTEKEYVEKIIPQLGAPMPQYQGKLLWDVKKDPNQVTAFNTKSTSAIGPHTEFFEFEGTPPKYLSLRCVTPSNDGQGATLLTDSRTILAGLNPHELEMLKTLEFEYCSSEIDSVSGKPVHTAKHKPIESGTETNIAEIFRFSTKYMAFENTSDFATLHKKIVDAFYKQAVRVDWAAKDVAIWNNHHVLHAREAYTNESRHLQRVLIAS